MSRRQHDSKDRVARVVTMNDIVRRISNAVPANAALIVLVVFLYGTMAR